MATVFVPAQWHDLTGGVAQVSVEGNSLGRILAGLDARFPGFAERACLDGAIAPGLAVSIDGAITALGLLARVGQDSEIHFLPAIGGG